MTACSQCGNRIADEDGGKPIHVHKAGAVEARGGKRGVQNRLCSLSLPPESRRPEIDFAALRQNDRIIDLLRNEGCTPTAVVRVNACEVITMLKESIPRVYRE